MNRAKEVDDYLESISGERATPLRELRELCQRTLTGYQEGFGYGGPTYSRNGVVEVGFKSQKHDIALYILKKDVVDRFRSRLRDAGKGAIRFRRPADMDFALIEALLEGTVASNSEVCD